MNLHTTGDLAQSFALRRQGNTLRQQMDRLTQELSGGRAADLTRHLSGNLARLAEIEHDLATLGAYRVAAQEVTVDAGAMQAALGKVQDVSAALSGDAITVGSVNGGVRIDTFAATARNALGAVFGALNSDVAGRALFSGTRSDRAPLASPDILLNDLRTIIAGAGDTAAVKTAIDSYFDTPGGGFETSIYLGGTTDLAPSLLGSGESVTLSIRADDTALRQQLKAMALAALADDPGLALPESARRDLVREAGVALLAGQDRLTALRADLGATEARLDQSATRIAAEITSLQMSRNTLISVDPFETASALEQVQLQIETLYTLTARASRLTLVRFLS